MITDAATRILSRVVVDENDCWNWPGATTRGYGVISNGPRNPYTHRVAYEAENGLIPDGLCVLHRCDNPLCCNPAHLFLGTRGDNTKDMIAKGRHSTPPTVRGEQHHSARFTEREIVAIRDRHKQGDSIRMLAAEFGVAISTIKRILNRRTWSHVA